MASGYANYFRPGTHKIEVKIAIRISEQSVATINVSCKMMGFVAAYADRLK